MNVDMSVIPAASASAQGPEDGLSAQDREGPAAERPVGRAGLDREPSAGTVDPTALGSVDISVIVPVWNDPVRVRLCLDALLDQSLPRERYEIIVVDNGSTDTTPSVVSSYPGLRLLTELKKGSYAARNTGIRNSRGRYVAFTDADCIPDRDWLSRGLQRLQEEPGIGILAGHITLFPTPECDSRVCTNFERIFSLNQRVSVKRGGTAATANWFSPLSVLQEAGGFDETLLSTGDAVMARRIAALGHKVVYGAGVEIRHPIRGQMGELLKKHRRTIGGKWDQSSSRWRRFMLLYRETRTAGGRVLRVLREFQGRWHEKAELLLLIFGMLGLSALEITRRALGGAAHRA